METKIFLSHYINDANKDAKKAELERFVKQINDYKGNRKIAIKSKEKIWAYKRPIYMWRLEVVFFDE